MDTKSLRHHKRPKKIKSRNNKGNADVLVVPPDILKKLGINIGNTDLGIQTGHNDQQSSETSILETANLMKKSVFLSPSFVPTVTNAISGEIEITSNKNFVDPAVVRNVSLGRKGKNTSSETITVHEAWQKDNQINFNGDLKIKRNFETNPNINGDSSYITTRRRAKLMQACNNISVNDSNDTQVLSGHSNKLSTEKLNKSKSTVECDVAVNGVNNSEFAQNFAEGLTTQTEHFENCLNSSGITDIQIKQAERDLISLEGSPVLIDATEVESHLISLEGSTNQMEQVNQIISLKSNIEAESNLNSIAESQFQIDPTEVSNQLISLEETTIQIEQSETDNNVISLKGSAIYIEPAENVISLEANAVLENQIEGENNFNSLEGSPIQIDPNEVEEHFISLEEAAVQIVQNETENNLISLEGSIIQMQQVENIIFLEESAVLVNQVEAENNIISLEAGSVVQIEQAENISLDKKNTSIEASKNNGCPPEDNAVQKICEDYLKNFLTKNGKLELKDNNINYDLLEDGIISSLPIVNGDFSELAENEIFVQIENAETDQYDSNTNPLNNYCIEHGSLTDLSKENCGNFNTFKNVNDSCANNSQDIAAPANKITPRVNIISEEIIPPPNGKDLKRCQSPFIRTLKPVALNAIIGPKKINDNHVSSDVKAKNSPKTPSTTELLNLDINLEKTESVIESNNCKTNFVASIVDEVNSTSDPKCSLNSSKSNAICAVTETEPVESCEESVLHHTLIDKDLKNNNDIFAKTNIKASSSNNSQHPNDAKKELNGSCIVENGSVPVLTEQEEDGKSGRDKSIGKKEINSIRNAYLTLTQGHSIQNFNYNENNHNLKACDDKQAFDENNSSDEKSICKDNLTSNDEKKSDKKHVTDFKKKSKKKKKTITEDETISEKSINDSANKSLADEQLNKILKSSKENGNTNLQIDKVKEIAEYIKKFAQIYKDKNKIVNKEVKKPTEIKKEVINSKSSMIKSKLSIQGVEKPGGNKGVIKDSFKSKGLKTYAREKKKPKQSCSSINISDRNETIVIVGTTDTELDPIDISTSYKQRDFCLCYDFGRLDIFEYDNSYEHVHFGLHNNNSDLESILSIYNDDTIICKDRTKLGDVNIMELTEDTADTNYFCWNYFLNVRDHKDEQIANKIDCCVDELDANALTDTGEITTLDNNNDSTSIMPEQTQTNDTEIFKDSHELEDSESNMVNSIMTLLDVDTQKKDEGQNENKGNQIDKLCPITMVEFGNSEGDNDGDNNLKIDENKQGPSKSSIETPKDQEIAPTKLAQHQKKNSQKRKLSARQSLEGTIAGREEPSVKKNIKCGVCNLLLSETEWDRHVTNEHYGVGWKAGNSFNFDDPDMIKKLEEILRTVGSLKCPICDFRTKKFRKFMSHIKTCIKEKQDCKTGRSSISKELVKCGVCQQNVQYTSWCEHIGKQHNYLAWMEGQDELNIEDETEVLKHLQSIIKHYGCLICNKCGLSRKRGKKYLTHIETCDGTEAPLDDSSMSDSLNSTKNAAGNESTTDKKAVKCGVCNQEVAVLQWNEHIGREHNYLAWEHGSPPLNVDDEEAVWNHLQQFIRHSDGLLCYKCGLTRKRVKMYLSHIKTCDGEGVSFDEPMEDFSIEQDMSDEKIYICGVCAAKVPVSQWNEHIGREHTYLAWPVGAPPLNLEDEEAVKEHLLGIIRNCEGLICYKCGLNRRRAKLYLAHVKHCDGSQKYWDESTSSLNLNSSQQDMTTDTVKSDNIVQCGVCDQDVSMSMWIDHIRKEHEYMAWLKHGEPLNVDDEDAVKAHLIKISRDEDGLICNRCGIIKKYPKSYLNHIRECTETEMVAKPNPKYELEISSIDISDVTTETVMCGACNEEIQKTEWLKHIDEDHDYLAWREGRPPLDLDDSEMIQRHLTDVTRTMGGLRCKKCGLSRKYAKSYLQHIKFCGTDEASAKLNAALVGNYPVECAVCSEKINAKDWGKHAMNEHYNVAWIVGATPIEVNNPYGVESYIKVYQSKHNNKLVCKRCGITRISAVGFYAHIITCGKTEEEMEMYKQLCTICNSKYLCIYKSQHMTMHREQEYAQERKILIANEKSMVKEEEPPVEIVGGRRKAAEKAKTVIEKYTNFKDEDGVHCPKCGFQCENESDISNHVCVEDDFQGSESDASVDLDFSSEEEDDDYTDIDSNISDEECEAQYDKETKSKKHGEPSAACKIQRLPYPVRNLNSYMRKSAEEFVKLHLTNDDLFPQWRNFDYELVSQDDIAKYMPPVEESCKVRYANNEDWMTYKRFEAKKVKDIITMYMGACIQSLCWVPPCVGENGGSYQEYISIVTHLASDIPRHFWHDKPAPEPGLVQIWGCGNLVSGVPEFALGLALDCGVIWGIDWCPSGARDVLDANEEPNKTHRLGLLAVASANGSAYVFAMPHPSSIKEDGHLFYKLKPVVEMRLAMDKNRNVYQATAIKWSKQKGHAHIVVGYSDGTMAYYDLLNESPLLRSTENDVTILYPYYDERAQIMCIEDVDVFPRMASATGPGCVVAGSVAGAGARVAPPGGARAAPAHTPATRVLFPPHWPGALLAGDDNLVCTAVNELEWYGGGRRVGSMRACCGCTWCGRVATLAAPLLRLMRTHPAYSELHRQVIATLQMIPFGNKRKRKNDELSMIMEPLTYDDAVSKYGIEFQRITAKDKLTQQKLSGLPRETFPERFPLSDVSSMEFCPSPRNHHKLAVATHSGLIFIINV